jgi:NitT/TauT family transport system ATP-binding protein
MSIVIKIDHKAYSEHSPALIQDFQLNLKEGEFVCLVGASGCGKTTLLNLIAGLDTHYTGHIGSSTHTPLKLGYVFQNPRLLPWRTVRENIELVLQPPYDTAWLDELFTIMQLTEAQTIYPDKLSLGMSRRVALIRAFAIKPELLLMDEPLVSLDAPSARQVRQLLLNLWQRRPHRVLYVTHDLREAIMLADRLVFLSAKPMQIIRSLAVPIARQARHDELLVEQFRQQLLNDYADIAVLL